MANSILSFLGVNNSIMMQAIGAMMRGESPQQFMKNLANTNPALRGLDLDNLDATAQKVCREHGVEKIVLGYPKNMNNTEGVRCDKTKEFMAALERRTGLPVILWDERLTTVAADAAMIEGGIRREDRREHVDEIAAVFILQGYLEYLRNSNGTGSEDNI